MFARSKILGVSNNGRLNVQPSYHNKYATKAAKKVEGSLMGADLLSNGSAINKSVNAFWQSSYQYMMTGFIPASPDLTDSQALALFFRDMYLHDSVAGSAVDIQSSFPFSDWELRGLQANDLKIYNDSLERLTLQELFPLISVAYLTDGFFAGSLVFDYKTKQFMDILIHDALSCEIQPSPFHNIDPKITVHTNGQTRAFIDNSSEYTDAYLRTMPAQFIDLLKSDAFELDPVSTLYVARRMLTDRAYTSYLQRLLPCYLIEKVLFRGTLVEAQRRQRATTHIQAGDDTWTPTDDELHDLTVLFQSTESDPLGAWIATRNNIQLSEFRSAGDMWKWYETSESLTPMKLRSLGISDAFLSGDASYAASESAYSTFVETVASYRNHLTDKVFYKKLFPLIAVVNDLYTSDSVVKPDVNNITQFLFNANNRQALRMPKIHWHKQLEARDEQSQFEMLERVAEHGIPVPLTTWIAAAGLDIEALIKDLEESKELEKKLEPYQSKSSEDEDDSMFAATQVEGSDAIPVGYHKDDQANWTTASMKSAWAKLQRVPLLSRKFSEEDNAEWEVSSDGKRHLKVHQEAARKDRLYKLAKIISKYNKDPNYRDAVVKANAKRGTRILKGF
nr:MAG TPA: portal protein [Caudoviricetes sp.]